MLKQKFPNYKVTSYCPSGSWQTSRYIQIHIDAYNDKNLHYEYRIDGKWEGRVELHFEGDWETKYGLLIDRLIIILKIAMNLYGRNGIMVIAANTRVRLIQSKTYTRLCHI